MNTLERFERRYVVAESGCWLWTGPLNNTGYGCFARTSAHRWAYAAMVGPIPDGYQIDHLCRVRRCVNPSHLEAVTRSENNRRAAQHRVYIPKTHCPHGHAYDETNAHINGQGYQVCLACLRSRSRAYRANQKRMKECQWPA